MKAKILLLQLFLLLFATGVSAQGYTDDPGHKAFAKVGGIRFSVPKELNLEKIQDPTISFMRHAEYGFVEFVAVPEGLPDKDYLTALSTKVAAQMFPKEKPFKWKITSGDLMIKKSKFQTDSGWIKGMNDANGFIQLDYVMLKIKGRNIVVGYANSFGPPGRATVTDAKWSFDLEGTAGESMPGLYALAHIIVSITREKYKDINSGIFIEGVPE